MRPAARRCRLAVVAVAAMVGTLLPGSAGAAARPSAAGPVTPTDLARLTAAMDRAIAQVQRVTAALERDAAVTVALRIQQEQLQQAQAAARQLLDDQIRSIYENGPASPLLGFQAAFVPDDAQLLAAAQQHEVAVTTALRASVTVATARVAALQAREQRLHAELVRRAVAAEVVEQHAGDLLARAEAAYAAQQQLAALAALRARQALLDQLSSQLTAVVAQPTPAELQALANQAPILAALDAAGAGIPTGYEATTQVLHGIASWYGPGFVGSPTSSGAPYDPEKLTCAMLLVPLGTVVHVETNGTAVNCLVNDHGPYVGGRIIDMSVAGARALGYTGLADVTVTVLAAL